MGDGEAGRRRLVEPTWWSARFNDEPTYPPLHAPIFVGGIIEIHTPKGERTIHAFDAKYRREDHNSTYIPLREDIDKMHAYRDAIGQVTSNDFQRTLQSAIVLFPAPTNPAYESHPFHMSLPHGIGGLPLLPGDPTTPTTLRKHITQNILP